MTIEAHPEGAMSSITTEASDGAVAVHPADGRALRRVTRALARDDIDKIEMVRDGHFSLSRGALLWKRTTAVGDRWVIHLKSGLPYSSRVLRASETGLELTWQQPMDRIRLLQPLDLAVLGEHLTAIKLNITVRLAGGSGDVPPIKWIALLVEGGGSEQFFSKFRIEAAKVDDEMVVAGTARVQKFEANERYSLAVQLNPSANKAIIRSVSMKAEKPPLAVVSPSPLKSKPQAPAVAKAKAIATSLPAPVSRAVTLKPEPQAPVAKAKTIANPLPASFSRAVTLKPEPQAPVAKSKAIANPLPAAGSRAVTPKPEPQAPVAKSKAIANPLPAAGSRAVTPKPEPQAPVAKTKALLNSLPTPASSAIALRPNPQTSVAKTKAVPNPLTAPALPAVALKPQTPAAQTKVAAKYVAESRPTTSVTVKTAHVIGKVEEVTSTQVRGWLKSLDDDAPPIVEVHVNGALYDRAAANIKRGDLRRSGVVIGGGFLVPLMPEASAGTDQIDLFLAGTKERIAPTFSVQRPGVSNDVRDGAKLAHTLLKQRAPRVTILIPVFNARAAFAACIDSVFRYSTGDVRLLVIDDASTDPGIVEDLAKLEGLPRVTVLRNASNLGFTHTVNRGLQAAAGDDIVLLNSDTRVTPRWLDKLRFAAHARPDIATATAVSDNAGIFSVDLPDRDAGWGDAEFARLVAQAASRLLPETPTAHGFCAYIRADALARVGLFDTAAFPRGYGEENDFSMRASYAGLSHVIAPRALVFHERSASFGAEKETLLRRGREVLDRRYPEYTAKARRLARNPDLLAVKHRVRVAAVRASSTRPRPRALFVISSRTGGTPQTNLDLMAAVGDEYDTFLLQCNRATMTFSRVANGIEEMLERHDLAVPIEVTSHRSRDYDNVVTDWLTAYDIELLHVRHFAWHSLGLIEIAADLDIPIVLSFHDFYTVCPTVKLLDNEMRHCAGTCTSGDGYCVPELWPKDSVPSLKHAWVRNWRQILAPVLARCDGFVTTVHSARDVIQGTFPQIRNKRFDVILHGRNFTEHTPHPTGGLDSGPLRILFPGNLGAAKGADIIAALAARDTGRRIEVHVAGRAAGALVNAPVIHHGEYTRDSFQQLVARVRPHLGGLLSVWPETYSHTLTEMWSAGLPVLAFDIGAVGERISESGAGWLMEISDSEAVARQLLAIADAPSDFATKVAAVARWQRGKGTSYTTQAMAERYLDIYRHVIEGKRGFRQLAENASEHGATL